MECTHTSGMSGSHVPVVWRNGQISSMDFLLPVKLWPSVCLCVCVFGLAHEAGYSVGYCMSHLM